MKLHPQDKAEALLLQAKLQDIKRGTLQSNQLFGPAIKGKLDFPGNSATLEHHSFDRTHNPPPGLADLKSPRIKKTLSIPPHAVSPQSTPSLAMQGSAPHSDVHSFIQSQRRLQKE